MEEDADGGWTETLTDATPSSGGGAAAAVADAVDAAAGGMAAVSVADDVDLDDIPDADDDSAAVSVRRRAAVQPHHALTPSRLWLLPATMALLTKL